VHSTTYLTIRRPTAGRSIPSSSRSTTTSEEYPNFPVRGRPTPRSNVEDRGREGEQAHGAAGRTMTPSSVSSRASCTPAPRAYVYIRPDNHQGYKDAMTGFSINSPIIRSRSWIRTGSSRSRSAISRRLPAGPRASRRRRIPGSTRPGPPSRPEQRSGPGKGGDPLPGPLSRPGGVRRGRLALSGSSPRSAPPPPSRRAAPAPVTSCRFTPATTRRRFASRRWRPRPRARCSPRARSTPTSAAIPSTAGRFPANIGTSGIPRVLRRRHAEPGVAVVCRPGERCEAAARIIKAFAAPPPLLFHPYPVTPYHADYLQHAGPGRGSRRRAFGNAPEGPRRPQVRARARLRRGSSPHLPRTALGRQCPRGRARRLLAAPRITLDGWLGPPWLKEGWFHAGSLSQPRW